MLGTPGPLPASSAQALPRLGTGFDRLLIHTLLEPPTWLKSPTNPLVPVRNMQVSVKLLYTELFATVTFEARNT